MTRRSSALEVVEYTESGLASTWAAPPHCPDWTRAAVEREASFTLKRIVDPDALRPPAPWDGDEDAPFPAIQRLRVPSPDILHTLPPELGARVGSRFLAASSASRLDPHSFVALDPGGDLSNWDELRWLDRSTGEQVRVTTKWPRHLDDALVVLESLAAKACDYSRSPRSAPLCEVVIDPQSVSVRGRISGMIDSAEDGKTTDLRALRPLYEEGDRNGLVTSEVRRLGPAAFARRYGVPVSTAWHISAARPPSTRTIAAVLGRLGLESERICALADCNAAVTRRNSLYCSAAHKARAYRQREKSRRQGSETPKKQDPSDDVTCPSCGTVLLGFAPRELCDRCKRVNNA